MSQQLQLRHDTAANWASVTPAVGEIVVDTTNNRALIGDGATAAGWPAAKLSEVITNTRTAVSDANYTALTTDRLIAYTAITAARVVTLPAASAYPKGTQLLIVDESGSVSSTSTITVNRAGSDTIDGATSAVIAAAYGYLELESNGSNAWTIVGLPNGAFAPNGAGLQFSVLETLVSPLSGASTNASLQIPANCIVLSVGARVTTAITGAPSYQVGVSGNATQFGSALSIAAGSTNFGLIGPTAFYAATTLTITATSGSFTGGAVRLSIHLITCPPSGS